MINVSQSADISQDEDQGQDSDCQVPPGVVGTNSSIQGAPYSEDGDGYSLRGLADNLDCGLGLNMNCH